MNRLVERLLADEERESLSLYIGDLMYRYDLLTEEVWNHLTGVPGGEAFRRGRLLRVERDAWARGMEDALDYERPLADFTWHRFIPVDDAYGLVVPDDDSEEHRLSIYVDGYNTLHVASLVLSRGGTARALSITMECCAYQEAEGCERTGLGCNAGCQRLKRYSNGFIRACVCNNKSHWYD